jgi:hypothetical protein
MTGTDVISGLLQSFPTFGSMGLIESRIGLVGYTEVSCSIDDALIELEERIIHLKNMLRHLLGIRIQTNAEKAFSLVYQSNQIGFLHVYVSILA